MNGGSATDQQNQDALRAELQPEWLRLVRRQVESLKFGTVEITVHDSKIVQIERVEKTRLDRSSAGS
jgi:hypothetical protein